jgi:hypothetical protein
MSTDQPDHRVVAVTDWHGPLLYCLTCRMKVQEGHGHLVPRSGARS